VSQEKKRVHIRVRDHGPGISVKDISKLFQPFHKSARDAANSAPGVGLGLSLCRRLAQSIGGELTLEQNSIAGAVFSLLLPLIQEKALSQ
jgi:signal transduction histidine kinase